MKIVESLDKEADEIISDGKIEDVLFYFNKLDEKKECLENCRNCRRKLKEMSVVVISSMKNDELSESILDVICDALILLHENYEIIDVYNSGFKGCLGERCVDREFNINYPYGCTKFDDCIRCNNKNTITPIYDSINNADLLVVLCGNKKHVFIPELYQYAYTLFVTEKETMNEKTYYYNGSFRRKKYLIISTKDYFHGKCIVDDIADKFNRLGMVYLDSFFVTEDNIEYMKHMLPCALNALI